MLPEDIAGRRCPNSDNSSGTNRNIWDSRKLTLFLRSLISQYPTHHGNRYPAFADSALLPSGRVSRSRPPNTPLAKGATVVGAADSGCHARISQHAGQIPGPAGCRSPLVGRTVGLHRLRPRDRRPDPGQRHSCRRSVRSGTDGVRSDSGLRRSLRRVGSHVWVCRTNPLRSPPLCPLRKTGT